MSENQSILDQKRAVDRKVRIIGFLICATFLIAGAAYLLSQYTTSDNVALSNAENYRWLQKIHEPDGTMKIRTALLDGKIPKDVFDAISGKLLFYAAADRDVLTCFALLDAGASIDYADAEGTTALDMARTNSLPGVVNAIEEVAGAREKRRNDRLQAEAKILFGRNIETFANAVHDGSINYAERDARIGLSVMGFIAYTGETPLLDAAVKNGGDVDNLDANGLAPLRHAAANNKTEMVHSLLAYGANPNWGNESPLLHAMNHENQEMIDSLKAHGARLFSGESAKLTVSTSSTPSTDVQTSFAGP